MASKKEVLSAEIGNKWNGGLHESYNNEELDSNEITKKTISIYDLVTEIKPGVPDSWTT